MGRRELELEMAKLEAELAGRTFEAPMPMEERLRAIGYVLRGILRALIVAMAMVLLVVGVAPPFALLTVAVAAFLGVGAGELLGRSRTREGALLLLLLLPGALLLWVGYGGSRSEAVVMWVGPARVLTLSAVLRFCAISWMLTSCTRALAVRYRMLLFVEVFVVASSVARALASHRHGNVLRPLWLSDWAWEHELQPDRLLLVIGGVVALAVLLLLVSERETQWSLASLTATGVLCGVVFSLLQVRGDFEPKTVAQLGLLEATRGEPPPGSSGELHARVDSASGELGEAGGVDEPGGSRAGEKEGRGSRRDEQDDDEEDDDEEEDELDGRRKAGGDQSKGRSRGGQSGDEEEGDEGEGDEGEGDEGASDENRDEGRGKRGSEDESEEQDEGGNGKGGQGERSGASDPEAPQQPSPPGAGRGTSFGGFGPKGVGKASSGRGKGKIGDPFRKGDGNRGRRGKNKDPGGKKRSGIGPPSTAPVALVRLGDDYAPPSQHFYFRQQAWSTFDGQRFQTEPDHAFDSDLIRSFPIEQRPISGPSVGPCRSLVMFEVFLIAEHAQPFTLDGARMIEPVDNPKPQIFRRAYGVEAAAQTCHLAELRGRSTGDSAWSKTHLQHYLDYPDDPRYLETAQKLTRQLIGGHRDEPILQAIKIKLWLEREFIHSGLEDHADAEDPAAALLFNTGKGNATAFTLAAVYLLRSLDIPARAALGYRVPADARRGSKLLVRKLNYRIWAELYIEGIGWSPLDISPQRSLDPSLPPVNDDVVDQLAQEADEGEDEEEDEVEPTQGANVRVFSHFRWIFASLLLLALGIPYGVKAWRRSAPYWCTPDELPTIGYRAALDMLCEVGLYRRYGETREAFCRRVEGRAPSFATLSALHISARMGDPARAQQSREEFQRYRWMEALSSFRRERWLWAPRWRRVLGRLDPTSVLRLR